MLGFDLYVADDDDDEGGWRYDVIIVDRDRKGGEEVEAEARMTADRRQWHFSKGFN